MSEISHIQIVRTSQYQRFVDHLDREHMSGRLPDGRVGTWITEPGFRISLDGDAGFHVIAKSEGEDA